MSVCFSNYNYKSSTFLIEGLIVVVIKSFTFAKAGWLVQVDHE